MQIIWVARTRASVNRRLRLFLKGYHHTDREVADIKHAACIPDDVKESHLTNKTDKPAEQMRF